MTSVFSTFWSGKITLREYVCINSFLANSHKYYIYSYEQLNGLPEGAELKNAEEIISKEEYLLYKQRLPNRWDLFSDKFRYNLLYKRGGWWVDTDIICLKKEIDIKLNDTFICYYDNKELNNAVLKFPKGDQIMEFCVKYIKDWEIANNFEYKKLSWGEFAPPLLTKAVKSLNRLDEVYLYQYAYPIQMKNTLDIFKKNKNKFILNNLKNAYFSHLWNEILKREMIPKNYLGEKGSFWYQMCLSTINKSPDLDLSEVKKKSETEFRKYILISLPKLYILKFKIFMRKVYLDLKKLIF